MTEPSFTLPTAQTMAVLKPRRFDPWIIPLLAFFLLAALLGTRVLFDSDLGFHLKAGQWIIQNHQVPSKDPFTYTASDHDYLDIQWLYQVLLYGLYRLGGYELLSLLNAVCALSLVWITWKRLRLVEIPAWTVLVILGVILFGIEIRFRARPEMLSCLFLSLVFWVLEMKERKGRDLSFLLPLLFAFWANVEGLFAVGWGILGIYLLADLAEGRKDVIGQKKYFLLAVLACFLNPYFIRGFLFPFTLFKSLSSETFQTIQEFRSPWLLGKHIFTTSPAYLWIYKAFSLALGVMVLWTLKKRKIRELGVYLAFFILSAFSWRNIELFLLACAPLAAACWKDLEWSWLGKKQNSFLDKNWMAWTFAGLLLALSLRVMTNAYYVDSRRPDRFGLGIREDCVAPGLFLSQNHLEGRILNTSHLGGWLEWEWGNKTFSDGRLEVMGEELFREEGTSFQPGGLLRLVGKYHPDILAFSPLDDRAWLGDLKFMPDWRPVHLDGNSVIYLRRGFGDQVPGLDLAQLEREWGISPDLPGRIRTALSSLPTDGEFPFWEGFWRRPLDPRGLKSTAYFCAVTGHLDDGEKFDLEAIRLCRGRFKDYYEQLWEISQDAHQQDLSDWCLKRL